MYTDKAAAIARAKERAQITDTTHDAYFDELITMSAGTVATVVHYRPFWSAARFLAQNPDLRDLSRAEGEAQFTLAQPRIDDLMAQQAAYDQAYGLTVPPGMEAIAANTSASSGGYIAGTTSVTTTAVW